MKKQRVVYFGSPEFSLPPLKTLYLGEYEIVGIYTQEPKKKFRGQKKYNTPVQKWAESQLLPFFTPKTLDDESLKEFQSLKPDVGILFAYGKRVPLSWLNTPLHGFINIHASLLPRWRGAAPVQRAIENNDKTTGVTIMKMNDRIDEGPILAQHSIEIKKTTNGKKLIDQISNVSCSLLYNTLKKYFLGQIKLKEQDHSQSTYAKKINKVETQVDWGLSADIIEKKVRAFYPSPAMWFRFKGQRFKILKVRITNKQDVKGKIINLPLTIACSKNSLDILEIQAEGKKPLDINEFVLGNNQFQINELIDDE